MIRSFDLLQFFRGLLMGAADIIPGVSGGTVALILGIYQRLVTAISHVDSQLLRLLRAGEFRAAFDHLDLRFLLFLVLGIGVGVTALASTMHHLLEHHREFTMAAFFGMILASTVIVARMVREWTAYAIAGLVLGFGFAFWLVGLPFLQNPPDGVVYLFFCGAIAICAMILPGISGAFVLVILGKYYHVTGVLKSFAAMQFDLEGFKTVTAFSLGAITGLLSFSKILRFLLGTYHAVTMAVLSGFMLGSLRKIWPFQFDTTPGIEDFSQKVFENVWPESETHSAPAAIAITAAAALLVVALERLSVRGAAVPDDAVTDEPGDRS